MRDAYHDDLTLPLQRTALLVVDVQEEQRSDPDYAVTDADRVIGNCARLLGAARASGVVVAHARYVRDFEAVPPRPFEPLGDGGVPTFSDADSPMVAFCAEVAPVEGEAEFVKNDASGFDGTGLAAWLEERGTEWLVICGVWTEACVAATVRDAIAAGYRVLLVKDACVS